VTDGARPPDHEVGDRMAQIADRMLAQRETEYGTATAMSDEERRRAYLLTVLICVGLIAATVIVALVLIAIDR
jgi:hypothetical protein